MLIRDKKSKNQKYLDDNQIKNMIKHDLEITLREFNNPCDVSNINDLMYQATFSPAPNSGNKLIPEKIENNLISEQPIESARI